MRNFKPMKGFELNSVGPNSLQASLLLEELRRLGVEQFFISPGLRLAAIVDSFIKSKLNYSCIIDERAAAFAALGYAKATGKPACLFCTSGTAVANYMPAVLEAYESQVPMILVTSDLAHEDYDRKELQACDQLSFLKPYLRCQYDFPAPSMEENYHSLLSKIDYAYAQSQYGPVQLNFRFRKPLLSGITNPELAELWKKNKANIPESWIENNSPLTSHFKSNLLNFDAVEVLTNLLKSANSPMIISGAGKFSQSLLDFCLKHNLYIIADILSPYRLVKNKSCLSPLTFFKNFPDFNPDLILELGETVCGKKLASFIAASKAKKILLTERLYRQDPYNDLSYSFSADPEEVFASIVNKEFSFEANEFAEIDLNSESLNSYSELSVCQQLLTKVNSNEGIFLSNSLAVREADLVSTNISAKKISANRGLNGIDGVIASTVGFAAGLKSKVWCLIGDIAAMHDLASFKVLAESENPVIAVILNNQGGAIFKLNYLKKEAAEIVDLISTPHNYNFAGVSDNFNLKYFECSDLKSLDQALDSATKINQSCVIEVKLAAEQTAKDYDSYL